MSEVICRMAVCALGILLGWMLCGAKRDKETAKPTLYDKEEIVEDCTVQILSCTKTGETSIGWWRGEKADAPTMEDGMRFMED